MIRKRKKGDGDKQDALAITAVEENSKLSEKALSEEEQRANRALESIERDLFGATFPERTSHAHPQKASKQDKAAGTALLEKESPAPEEELARDKDPFAEIVELVEREDEGEVIESTPALTEEIQPPQRNKALSEASSDEFRFLLDMDYESELGQSIGFDKIRSYHEKRLDGRVAAHRRAHGEFESQGSDVAFRREYAKQKSGRILHLVFSVLLWVLLMIYERPAAMARLVGGPFDGARYPASYILLGLQILLLDAALSYKSLWEGLVRLVRFSPVDYSFASVLTIGTFLYHIVQLFIPHAGYPALYLSPAAFCLALLSLVEFLNWYRESLTFDVVSARRQKFALVPRISVGGKKDSARERLLQGGEAEGVSYARPVGFVRNYFYNTAQHMEHHRNLGAQLLLVLALGVALGLFALAGGARGELVFRTVFATVLLSAPVASVLLTSVPMFFASVLRLRGKGAIIGERPIDACDVPDTIVLPDSEVFAAMEHEHFHLMENCDHHHVSVMARALLEKVGSPLAEAFSVDVESRINVSQLVLEDISNDGVTSRVGEKGEQILFGTVSYMRARRIPIRGLADDIPASVYNRLLCVAMDGRVCALFLVHYQLSDDVRALFRELDRVGVPVAVRTKDPCVREEILVRLLPHMVNRPRVIKPCVQELELRADRVDATVVALDSCKEVARVYATCRRIRRVGVWGKLLQTFSMTAGAALAALLAFLRTAPSALLVTLWLALWCGLYAALSYTFLRRPLDEHEEI